MQGKHSDAVLRLTLIAQRVDGVVYDAVWAEALSLGQQTQQRGNLQPHRVISFLREDSSSSSSTWVTEHSPYTLTSRCYTHCASSTCKAIVAQSDVRLYLVVVLQQDPDHALHALGLHRLACKVEQVLQGISGVCGLAEVNVQSC